MKIPNSVIEICQLQKQRKKNVSSIKKHNSTDYNFVMDFTFNLSNSATFSQRVWHILHNNKDVPQCLMCDNNVNWGGTKYNDHCSRKCAITNPRTHQRVVDTCMEKYGLSNGGGSKESLEKIKQHSLAKYGTENPFQNEDVKAKIRASMLENHGVEHGSQSPEIRKKAEDTCERLYGHRNPFQVEEFKDKIKATLLETTGFDHSMKNPETLQKAQDSFLARYGTKTYNGSQMPDNAQALLDDFDYMYEHHITLQESSPDMAKNLGVSPATILNYLRGHSIPVTKHKMSPEKAKAAYDKRVATFIKNGTTPTSYRVSNESNVCAANILNQIPDLELIKEHPVLGYFVDYYLPKHNLVVEYYGIYWHACHRNYNSSDIINFPQPKGSLPAHQIWQYDYQRILKIQNEGYRVHIIWSDDYKSNPQKEIQKLKDLINAQ